MDLNLRIVLGTVCGGGSRDSLSLEQGNSFILMANNHGPAWLVKQRDQGILCLAIFSATIGWTFVIPNPERSLEVRGMV